MAKEINEINISALEALVKKAEAAEEGKTSIELRKQVTELKRSGKIKDASFKYAEAALRSTLKERAEIYAELCTQLDPELGNEIKKRVAIKHTANADFFRTGTRSLSEM